VVERARKVAELRRTGLPIKEISEKMGISIAQTYKLANADWWNEGRDGKKSEGTRSRDSQSLGGLKGCPSPKEKGMSCLFGCGKYGKGSK
jgi:hypothetical protein